MLVCSSLLYMHNVKVCEIGSKLSPYLYVYLYTYCDVYLLKYDDNFFLDMGRNLNGF